MVKTSWGKVLPLLLILFILGACSVSFTTANFQDVKTASEIDETTYEPKTVTDVFSADTPVLYVTGVLANAPDGTKIKAAWVYLDADPQIDITESELESSEATTNFYFQLSRPDNGWPEGKYAVNLYIDDKLEKTVNFEVK